MQALISPNEPVISYDGTVLGSRVAQVSVASNEVAPPLFWIECADDIVADHFYYAAGAIIPIPEPPQFELISPAEGASA